MFKCKGNNPIPIDKFLKIINPVYKYIKIIPDKSIRNYSTNNIAKAIKHTYKSLEKRIKFEDKKIWIETNFKIAYLIDITATNAEFYFIVPEIYLPLMIEKLREIWTKATLEIIDTIEDHSENVEYYQLSYKKEDALSLNVDKKNNEPLNSILSVMEIMKDDDRITIVYNFQPRSNLGWDKIYNSTKLKIKEHKSIEKKVLGPKSLAINITAFITNFLNSILQVLNDFLGNGEEINIGLLEALTTVLEQQTEISAATRKKETLGVINGQIAILTDSVDKTRKENNALSVCNSYKALDEDNELIYKKVNEKFKITDYILKGIEANIFSTDECQNFLQIPARHLLKQFKINHIKTEETKVPEQLQKGFLSLGYVKYRGHTVQSFFEDEYNIGNLPLVLIGAQGSGKTTYIKNMAKYCSQNNEGVFLIDIIKNCEMSEEIVKVIPKEKLLVLDLASENDIQGLGYNEIKIDENMTAYKKMSLANLQSQQVMALVDSISVGDPLSSRMRRFLNSACNVVFVQGCSSIKNVIECLENHKKRLIYIESLNDSLKELLEDDINTLNELDEWSKITKDNPNTQVVGTKESKIEYILDRISMLREDFKLKYMYNKSTKDNINLVDCMEQGKVVLIKMKESDFPTKMIKNILVTYWISKIWLTSQIRGSLHDKPLRCNVVVDEIFQAPTSMKTLEYILPQSRKFGCKFVFSTQYIRQLENIFDTLEASGSSYMLLKGSMEDDFNHFKSKLENFEYEDLKDMEKYHSLNLIYYSKGYASFISKLPKPIK